MSIKIEVLETDMSNQLENFCVDVTIDALRCGADKDVAAYLKDSLENRFGPTWHCVVGKSFGSRVSFEPGNFILMRYGGTSILIFRCGSNIRQ
ncbi:unnamed protein product [Bursaphelenchus okinawaensis]|uniref:Dynein light chain n=1 Tax=Bursaphelenchus okinawaensis TaxID=465554 RepID=A0A811KVC9_9BILA|nr:unnamed protein product [Bursaphelenchus okinawaensis]CAG9112860.1 unnamed protein product [Bursaphelenchus okinawaensis]